MKANEPFGERERQIFTLIFSLEWKNNDFVKKFWDDE